MSCSFKNLEEIHKTYKYTFKNQWLYSDCLFFLEKNCLVTKDRI